MKGKDGQRCLEQLYTQYYNQLMIIACSYTHDRSSAEDLVQGVFLKAILSYRPGGSFLCWAGKVLCNDFYNLQRSAGRQSDQPFDESQLSAQEDLLSAYIKKEERIRLSGMISLLPLKFREIMIDSVYLQLSNREIAENRGMSEENVRQIKSRAKKMLLKMKEEEDGQD